MTWHQSKRPVPLYHETKWAAVTDTPGGFCSSMLFDTKEDADRYASRVAHTYVLRPRNQWIKKKGIL